MANSLLKTLLFHKAILIKASVTNQVYIDADRKSYVFFYQTDAEKFVTNSEISLIFDEPQYYDINELLTMCYENGTSILVLSDGGHVESIHLSKNRVKKSFYNSRLNAAVALFKETKDAKYLKEIASCNFVIPIRIKTADNGKNQDILYGTVHFGDTDFQYIAFTDIKEYNIWAEKVDNWEPLLVTLDVMCQISKSRGYLVNPMGNRLMLPSTIMEKYREYSS